MERRLELAQRIGIQVTELHNDADAFTEVAARALGLNANDIHCLALIALRGAMTAGELAEAASLTPGAITTLVDRLERAGFVQRQRDAEDRRRIFIGPTQRARIIAAQIWGPLGIEGAAMLMRFTEEQLEVILEAFTLARTIQKRHTERVSKLTLAELEPPAAQ